MTKKLVAINAEWLVESIDEVSTADVSKEWIGLIVLPTVSCIAGPSSFKKHISRLLKAKLIVELVTTINVSVKDQLTLSISVAVGSTIVSASGNPTRFLSAHIMIANCSFCDSVRHLIHSSSMVHLLSGSQSYGGTWMDFGQATRAII